MDTNLALYVGRAALETALLVSAPLLVTCLVTGVALTLFQAVTSIRDMTLTIVPKLIAMGLVTLLFGNWMLDITLRFTNEIFIHIQNLGH